MRFLATIAILLPALAFATCGDSDDAPTPGSGIRGVVYIGPVCPVVQANSPCPDRPFEATIHLLDSSGRLVGETRSDASGRFSFAVPSGTYTLHPVSGQVPPSAADQSVVVPEGGVAEVTVNYDSGIR